jgi:large subunit ribosomal protein L27
MAHKKGMGSTRNGRESHSKRLGVKIYGGDLAIPGNILVRQRGTTHHPGNGVGMGKDHTLFAMREGIVLFRKGRKDRSFVHILSAEEYSRITGFVVEEKLDKKAPANKPEKTGARSAAVPAAVETAAANPKAELLAIVGEADAASADDLKQLTGLGPATEKKLNDVGIYTYAQIAKLTKPARALVEQLIGFKAEKIEENEWVAEAKKLKG